ncbi:MAG: alpha/beta fold hydrolase [Pseudomonadota bacterium]
METIESRLSKRLDRPEILQYVFHPRRDTSATLPDGVLERFISVDSGVQVGVRGRLLGPDAHTILFFHGNGEIGSDYDDTGPLFNANGFNFLVADYRGYGKSGGNPALGSMIEDAHSLYAQIGSLFSLGENSKLVLMGRSLGSVPALELAAAHNDSVAALILDSAFANTYGLLERIGVPVSMLGVKEDDLSINVKNIEKVTKPTLIIHGHYDRLIPMEDAETLMSYSGAGKKQLVMIPGAGHNDIFAVCGEAYFGMIRDFVIGARRRRLREK